MDSAMMIPLFGASWPFSYLEMVIFETMFPMAEQSSSMESPFMMRAFLSLAEKMERFAIAPSSSSLPHNFHTLAVLELVRGSVGEGVFAADERAVDAVDFDGGDCVAALCPLHNPFGALSAVFAFAGLAAVAAVGCGHGHGDGIGGYGEVVVTDKAVVGGCPFGAASAVEGGEVELVDFHGVVVAEPERVHVEYGFAVEPCLHAAVLVAVAGRGDGVHTYFVYNTVPGAGGELLLRDGAVQVPLEIVAVFGALPHKIDELHGVAVFAPHDACAPAVAGFGQGVAGVALAAA